MMRLSKKTEALNLSKGVSQYCHSGFDTLSPAGNFS